jgi:branched-chain amino acid aminotransferase
VNLPFVLKQDSDQAIPLAEVTVPLNDRSFLFGDSVYEVISTRKGRAFFVDDHLDRLYESAAGIYMTIPWEKSWFCRQIERGVALALENKSGAENTKELYIRIIVSRGLSDFNIDTRVTTAPPHVYFIFKTCPEYTGRYIEQGFSLSVSKTRRSAPEALNPALKTGNYLNNVMCLHEATSKGADDSLILDLQGYVTEVSTSNFFIVKDRTLITAPIEIGILGGITRKHLFIVAEKLGLATEIRPYTLEEVWHADECFVSSSLKGAMPVYQIDAHQFPPGYGPVTQALNTAYWKHVDDLLDAADPDKTQEGSPA